MTTIEELIISDRHKTNRHLDEEIILAWKNIFKKLCSYFHETKYIDYKPIVVSSMGRDVHTVKYDSTNFVVIDENLFRTIDNFNCVLYRSTEPSDALGFFYKALSEGFRISGAIELAASCATRCTSLNHKYSSYTENTSSDIELLQKTTSRTQMEFILCHEIQHDIIERDLLLDNKLNSIAEIIVDEIIPERIQYSKKSYEYHDEFVDSSYILSDECRMRYKSPEFIKKRNYALKEASNRFQDRWLTLSKSRDFLIECFCDIEATKTIIKALEKTTLVPESFGLHACFGAMRILSILANCNFMVEVLKKNFEYLKLHKDLAANTNQTALTPDFADEINLRLQVLYRLFYRKMMLKDLELYFSIRDQERFWLQRYMSVISYPLGLIGFSLDNLMSEAIECYKKRLEDHHSKDILPKKVDSLLNYCQLRD